MDSWPSSVSREHRALVVSLGHGCLGSWKMELPAMAFHGGEIAVVPLGVVSISEWPMVAEMICLLELLQEFIDY